MFIFYDYVEIIIKNNIMVGLFKSHHYVIADIFSVKQQNGTFFKITIFAIIRIYFISHFLPC